MAGFARGAWRAMTAAAWFAAAPALAQTSADAVKAAFLPKFVRYITLPATAAPADGQPYYLCMIGRDPFGGLVDRAAASETVDGHAVAVRRFADAGATAVSGCHIAFVAGSNDQATQQMLYALRRQPTLTVTDARLGRSNGMIHFVVTDGRVRFEIDDAAATARGIAISSRLLALSVNVKQRTP